MSEEKSKISNFLFDLFRANKGIETVLSDFNEATGNEIKLFWKKIKPIFIQEDKDLVAQIEEKPNDVTLQTVLDYQIKKKLQDAEFAKEANELLAKIDKLKPTENASQIGFQAQTVNMKGKNVAGIIIQNKK